MVVGTIDHEAGTRDLRRLSNLRRSMPAVFAAGTMAGLSMAAGDPEYRDPFGPGGTGSGLSIGRPAG